MTLESKEQRIKDEIVQAARQLFQRYGLNKTTMEDIARAAGKGKSSLYYYYRSKEEILEDVITLEMQEVLTASLAAVEGATTAREKMKRLVITRIVILREKAVLYDVIRSELQNMVSTLANNTRDRFDRQEIDLIKTILRFGIDTNEFKNIDHSDLDLMASLMVSSQKGIELDTILYERFPEIEDRIGAFIDLLCDGLGR